jgi:hypothetical protein
MPMPKYLIGLGLLALSIVVMGMVSVISGSWVWSAATGCFIVLWLALAVSYRNGPIAAATCPNLDLVGTQVPLTRQPRFSGSDISIRRRPPGSVG